MLDACTHKTRRQFCPWYDIRGEQRPMTIDPNTRARVAAAICDGWTERRPPVVQQADPHPARPAYTLGMIADHDEDSGKVA